jgi:NADH:ubiquinone oxidoreductase subunit E
MTSVATAEVDRITDPLEMPDQRATIEQVVAENRGKTGATMVVLNELQNQIGYISEPMQRYVSRELRVPMSQVHGVISFYSFFSTQPRGKHRVSFCMGTACYVGGAPQLVEKAKQVLGVKVGETTGDWQITLECCRCVGACSQAPVVMIGDDVYGRVTPNQLPKIIEKYR